MKTKDLRLPSSLYLLFLPVYTTTGLGPKTCQEGLPKSWTLLAASSTDGTRTVCGGKVVLGGPPTPREGRRVRVRIRTNRIFSEELILIIALRHLGRRRRRGRVNVKGRREVGYLLRRVSKDGGPPLFGKGLVGFPVSYTGETQERTVTGCRRL